MHVTCATSTFLHKLELDRHGYFAAHPSLLASHACEVRVAGDWDFEETTMITSLPCAGCMHERTLSLISTTNTEIPNIIPALNMSSHHVNLAFQICNFSLFDESMHVKI